MSLPRGYRHDAPFGDSDELFPRYGWTWLNSLDRARLVGQLLPNPFGLFDMLGNLWEWCHDGRRAEKEDKPFPYPTGTTEKNPAHDEIEGESHHQGIAPDAPWWCLRLLTRSGTLGASLSWFTGLQRSDLWVPGRPDAAGRPG